MPKTKTIIVMASTEAEDLGLIEVPMGAAAYFKKLKELAGEVGSAVSLRDAVRDNLIATYQPKAKRAVLYEDGKVVGYCSEVFNNDGKPVATFVPV